jgi:hypothetical protein
MQSNNERMVKAMADVLHEMVEADVIDPISYRETQEAYRKLLDRMEAPTLAYYSIGVSAPVR